MVRIGMGLETQHGEFNVPIYNSQNGRSVLTLNPIALNLGDYRLEPSITITTEDIKNLYRRLRR
jgi:hypothetical protein